MTNDHPGPPVGVNHIAYQTLDLKATHQFYTKVLGCRLAGALRSPGIRSTSGEESGPFLHVFYETENGECLAFFALEGSYERRDDGLPSFTRHLALGVKDAADLERWQQELSTQGVEVSPAIDHDGIWQSIYVWDPNGIRLELTFQNRPLGPADAAEGAVELENWLTEHSGTAQLSH